MTEATATTTEREIVLSRVFDAPRERVFEAWTEREQIAKWWGPNGFTTTTQEMDVRPGGKWIFVMHGPQSPDSRWGGQDYDNVITYREVVRPDRLVFDHGDANDPAQFEQVVTFEEQGGKTLVTMRSIFPSKEARDYVVREVGAIEGGQQTLARLGEFLAAP